MKSNSTNGPAWTEAELKAWYRNWLKDDLKEEWLYKATLDQLREAWRELLNNARR